MGKVFTRAVYEKDTKDATVERTSTIDSYRSP